MDEPTDKQLKVLRKDIMSGLVMTVTTEHYNQLQAEKKRLIRILKRFVSMATLISQDPTNREDTQELARITLGVSKLSKKGIKEELNQALQETK